ncbi:MAG: hypothetical protein FWD68_01300 [Alphaproteobacteria bacterium]|nr:hypothetical protein [Alphaproteobacteria bacterium]
MSGKNSICRGAIDVAGRLTWLIRLSLVAGAILVASLQGALAQSGSGGNSDIQTQIVNGVIQNIIVNVRDQIQQRRIVTDDGISGLLQYSAEGTGTGARDRFSGKPGGDPFSAFAYYTKAPLSGQASQQWLYGANLVGSGDRGISQGLSVTVGTAVGAFDITKIGIFSATDSLTFIGTGGNSWANTSNYWVDTTTTTSSTSASASGTLAYINGGFSTDFGILSSWTSSGVAGGDSSAISYAWNVQYRYTGPHSFWFEPTVGVAYSESFNGDFDQKLADSTEVHGGLRFGTQMKWMGYTVQPMLSGVAFKVVDQSGVPPIQKVDANNNTYNVYPAGATGFRGAGKITVLWTPNFSSYIDLHASTISSPDVPNIQLYGVQGGLRYTF